MLLGALVGGTIYWFPAVGGLRVSPSSSSWQPASQGSDAPAGTSQQDTTCPKLASSLARPFISHTVHTCLDLHVSATGVCAVCLSSAVSWDL